MKQSKEPNSHDKDLTTLDLNTIDSKSKASNKKKADKQKKLLIIASAVTAVVVIVLAIFMLTGDEEPKKTVPTPTSTPVPSPTPEAVEPTPTPEPVVLPAEFVSAQAVNPHVYAWIEIPDTVIAYPMLQHPEDNYYYLTHTMYGEEKTAGSIYTENYNSKDFTDPNTIIYGHNMRDGSMFKALHKFKDLDFFNTHRTMYIYTPTQKLEYRIFAAYITDNRHLLYTYNFADPGVFTTYLNEIFNGRSNLMQGGNLDTSINLNSANKIITMQTCTGSDYTRLLVQAVLVNVTGTPDIIVPSTTVTTGEAVAK